MITKIKGHVYVSNLNTELIQELVDSYKTNQDFLKAVGFSDIVLINIRNGGKVRIETIYKLMSLFPYLEPHHIIKDFCEDEYVYFDIDLKKYKPVASDLNDTEKIISSIVKTIKIKTECLGLEKQNSLINLMKRLVLEANYYGIMLEKMNKSAKVINTIEKIRNGE